jgi:hypothetical protein
VVVDCQVRQRIITTPEDLVEDELGAEHAISVIAGNIVNAICGWEQLSTEQPDSTSVSRHSTYQDRPMLITVSRKVVPPDLVLEALGQDEHRSGAHGLDLSHINTF